jgi:hypothetical protein
MTTTIERIDWNYVRDIDVNQLWGQAVALYRAGEPWRLSAEECDVRDDTNEEHKVGSLLDGWIETWFDLTDDPRDAMKASGIASHLMSKDIRLHGSETAQAMAIAKALQRLGANKGEGRMRYWYVGIRPRHEPNNTPPPEGVSTSQALTEVPTKALTKNTPLQSHGEHMRTCKHLLEQTLEKQSYQGGEEKTERVDGFSAEVPTGTHTTGEIKHQEEENTPVSTLVGTSSRSTDQVRTEVSVVPGTTNVNAQAESEPLAPPRLVIVPEGDGWYVCEHEGDELYHTNNVCYPTEAAARMVAQQIYTQAQHE